MKKRVNAETWVHNLCMLISQPTGHIENDRQKILHFGDGLRDLGLVAASHICYIVANVPFGCHKHDDVRMALLGLEHKQYTDKASNVWADPLHTQLTEIYQYARTLHDKHFFVPSFQEYKYEYAMQLADYGYAPQNMAYLESIGQAINSDRTYKLFGKEFCHNVAKHANRVIIQDADNNTINDLEIPDWVKKVEEYNGKSNFEATPQTTGDMNDAVPLMSARSQPTVPELPFSPILPDTSRSEETATSASGVFSSDRMGSGGSGYFPPDMVANQLQQQYGQHQEEPIATWQPQQEPWQPVASYDNNDEGGNNDTVDHYSSQQKRRGSNDAYGNNYNSGATATDNTNAYYGSDDANATYNNDSQLQSDQGAAAPEQPSTVYYEKPAPVGSSTTMGDGDTNGADSSNAPPPPFFNPAQTMGGGVSSAPSFSDHFQTPFNPPPPSNGFNTNTNDNNGDQSQQQHNNEQVDDEIDPEDDLFRFSSKKDKDTKDSSSKNSKNNDSKKSSGGFKEPVAKQDASSGFFASIGKIFRRDKEVHLPDDNDKSLVYDEKLKKWIDKNAGPEDDTAAPPPPPPMGGFGAGGMTMARKTPSAATPVNSATTGMPTMPPSSLQPPQQVAPIMPPAAPMQAPQPVDTRPEMPLAPLQGDDSSAMMAPPQPPPPASVAEPTSQTMRGKAADRRAARRTLLEQSKAAAQKKKQEEEEAQKKKHTGPPSMFSLKASGGRRGLNRYANTPGAALATTKSTPMTAPNLDPFAPKGGDASQATPGAVPFFTPGAPQKTRHQDQN